MAFHRGRGRPAPPGRPARSGIRTRGGQYKKFDSQRVKEVDQGSETALPVQDVEVSEDSEDSDDESDEDTTTNKSYSTLLASLKAEAHETDQRPRKRRKVSSSKGTTDLPTASNQRSNAIDIPATEGGKQGISNAEDEDEPEQSSVEDDDDDDDQLDNESVDDDSQDPQSDPESVDEASDPYETQYQRQDDEITRLIETAKRCPWPAEKRTQPSKVIITEHVPKDIKERLRNSSKASCETHVKQRLHATAQKCLASNDAQAVLLPYLLNYTDLLCGHRTPGNAAQLRQLVSLHAVNHVLKGRDKVIKNNNRLAQADPESFLELRDQGFTRPKVLIVTETRQMCAKYAEAIVKLFNPEQQENSKRFLDAFSAPIDSRDMPEDYNELFGGNNDNNFLTTIKFTRKTLKFYSAFYQSDIIFASPLGLQRVVENEDKRKQDHDFLSSIEIVILDQADASQMQNFENIEVVFKNLNLQPKELRDCDVNRVRNFYLDGNAQHFRQTIVLSGYITPELNKLYNSTMINIAGKAKVTKHYSGAIQAATGLGIKQTFSRFTPKSPADDPDARFKFFTTSVLPLLLRLPRPSSGGQGILIFIPSYFDFLRVRNFFATSTMTENISFGAIHDYSEISDQRRARSHFLSGRHSILLYTQRAHHFFRIRMRGVKNVVMYGVPEHDAFYQEIVADSLSSSLAQGTVSAAECTARSIFSKFDALKMERIVGSDRVKNMLSGVGDTFDFV